MYIERWIKDDIKQKLEAQRQNKIIILYGARQVGKTSLMESILKKLDKKILWLTGDEAETARVFSSRSFVKMRERVSTYDILFIDEAQRIENIGLNLKILHDKQPELKIVVTGSSSFELADSMREPLTGRTWICRLHPTAVCELKKRFNSYELSRQAEDFLVLGSYPELLSIENLSQKREYVYSLTEDYLYKDVLKVEGVKNSRKIKRLLQLLAFQIGSEVSMTELSGRLEINKKTVERYIDLLEKFFVIFSLSGFRRNLRKEVAQKPKIYFCDLGIRNAIINNFNTLENRNDLGPLWENFIINERLKYNSYRKNFAVPYFWRTYTGAELDYVEEDQGKLSGYEIKWAKKAKAPLGWTQNYKADFECINRDNFLKFIS